MRKRIPNKLSPPRVVVLPDKAVHQVRRYKVITPLFGGGAEPQRPDAVTVVRASEIRGMLRFWWRATRGGQFNGNLEALRRKEAEIWGAAATKDGLGPSRTAICVKVIHRGHHFQAVDRRGHPVQDVGAIDSIYSYVAFPLRDISGAYVLENVEFDLEIQYSKRLAAEVEASLWAWETFGGVGARTRRGFGALQLVEIEQQGEKISLRTASCNEVASEITKGLQKHLALGKWCNSTENIPHLTSDVQFQITGPGGNPVSIWENLIKKYQAFRQRRHKKYGLSLWPEANTIRVNMGRAPKWPRNIFNPRLVKKFPRGQFGLPIIFHMPHDKNLSVDSYTLQGQAAPGSKDNPINRLASPLILRPLACDQGAVGLAVILENPRVPPYGLEVDGLPQEKKAVRSELSFKDAKTEPLKRVLNGEPDVLKAFLDTL